MTVPLVFVAALAFHLSYNTEGTLRVIGICLGVGYLVFVIVLNRWLQRRFTSRNARPS